MGPSTQADAAPARYNCRMRIAAVLLLSALSSRAAVRNVRRASYEAAPKKKEHRSRRSWRTPLRSQ